MQSYICNLMWCTFSTFYAIGHKISLNYLFLRILMFIYITLFHCFYVCFNSLIHLFAGTFSRTHFLILTVRLLGWIADHAALRRRPGMAERDVQDQLERYHTGSSFLPVLIRISCFLRFKEVLNPLSSYSYSYPCSLFWRSSQWPQRQSPSSSFPSLRTSTSVLPVQLIDSDILLSSFKILGCDIGCLLTFAYIIFTLRLLQNNSI